MKKWSILELNHECYGRYGLVTKLRAGVASIISSKGFLFEIDDAEKYPSVCHISIVKKYNVGNRRFCKLSAGNRVIDVVVREDMTDQEETRTDVIIKMGFAKLVSQSV